MPCLGDGEDMEAFVHTKGKCNKKGKKKYKAFFVTHINSHMDLLYRFNVQKEEPVPIFWLKAGLRPIYHSITDYCKHLPSSTMNKSWKKCSSIVVLYATSSPITSRGLRFSKS
jgi:hypothetical protein